MEQLYEDLIQSLLEKGFGSVVGWFSSEEISALRQALVHRYDEDAFRLAKIGNGALETKETAIRNDRIHWLYRNELVAAEKCFFEKTDNFIQYLNRTCFAGIQSSEFHYAVYEPGSFYKRHVDQFNNDDRRRFSMVLYLNESWEEGNGGELMIYSEDPVKIQPQPGRIVFFSSDLEHEVLTSYHQRFSLTGWLRTI